MDLSPFAAINPCGYPGLAVIQTTRPGYSAHRHRPASNSRSTCCSNWTNNMAETKQKGVKQKGELKTARIPIKIVPVAEPLRKPSWIRVKAGNSAGRFGEIKTMLREKKLHTVCEEATCPNIGECFGRGTATFMILGDICTRRCPFCDVGHGQPLPPNPDEPRELAESVAALKLRYVVITSVDRDDLRDGGAQHFVDVISNVRELSPTTTVETLVPDFRGRMDVAARRPRRRPARRAQPQHGNRAAPLQAGPPRRRLQALAGIPQAIQGPLPAGADQVRPDGRPRRDRRRNPRSHARPARHDVEMLTIGQYLAPSGHHLPVTRYVHPDTFKMYEAEALKMGFTGAACAPMVRSLWSCAGIES
jgi:lipoyl synthase